MHRGTTTWGHGEETLSTCPGARPRGEPVLPHLGLRLQPPGPRTGSVCGLRCHLWSFVMWPQDTHK